MTNRIMTTQPRIIRNINGSKSHVLLLIKVRQKGLCRKCEQQITQDHDIVSRGHSPRYYHKHCAQKLNII